MIDQSLNSLRPLERATAARNPRISTVQLLLLMLGMLSGATAARAATLNVQLTDALTGTPIANQSVAIFEKDAAGALTWKRGGTTDASGRTSLEVNPPTPGSVLVARTRPFALTIERQVAAGGNVSIQAGTVRVQVLNGVSGAPLVGSAVTFGSLDASGKFTGLNTVNTDADGQLRLDPAALGSVDYALRANSPVDGSLKLSAPITSAGNFEFKVGNPAVTVNLTDWTSNAALSAQRVEVRERLGNGTLAWITARETDGNGRVKLDLDGLESGRRYVVRVKPYLQYIERDVTAAGWISIRAGRVPATVINGDSGAPLANTEVSLFTRTSASAAWQYEFKSTTGSDGTLLLDPVHLGVQEYSLRAASPVDGSLKYSQVFKLAGPLNFAVGNRGLTVKVANAKNNAPIGALQVWANEILSTGSLGSTITRITDTAGIARFDLDGLGKGKRYRIRTKPFFHTIERDISTTGWLDVPAGVLRVRVESGANGMALPATEVKVHKLLASESRQTISVMSTERDGTLVLDPPDLGNTRYQLSAVSPIDGSIKFSQVLDTAGDAVFSVGSAGVTVRLRDYKSGSALAGQTVTVYERKTDGSLMGLFSRSTDASGQLRLDLDGVGTQRHYVLRTKPYLQTIERDITGNGLLDIRAGNLRVLLKRGDNGQAYPDAAVRVLAVRADGEYEGITTFQTPANGELVLDLADLGTTQYVFRAPSAVDGSLKYSPVVSTPGQTTFTVGNTPLPVRLVDFQTRAVLGNTMLQVHELNADDSLTWVTQRATDANGAATFDLDGLGKGRRYVVRTRPFAQWLDYTVSSTTPLVIEGGRATVLLMDTDNGRPMAGVDVQARNKAADGSLSNTIGAGATDANGRIRFDPPALGAGGVAVFTAVNPFANGVNYHSAPSVNTGLFRFDVSREGPRRLDRTPAELSVTLPRVSQRVSLGGVVLGGYVSDDTEIRDVAVELFNGNTLLGRYLANVDVHTRRWTVQTPSLAVADNTRLTVRVTATDRDYNGTTTQFAVTAVQDVTPPTVSFRSPSEGSVTNGRGLLVMGFVRDDTQWKTVQVRIEEGSTIRTGYRTVEVDPSSGDWAFAVPAELMKGKTTLTIRARATDTRLNAGEQTRTVSIDPNSDTLRHLLARATFGESPALLDEARRTGYTAFLDQQLAPFSIDDSALETRLATMPVTTRDTLVQQMLTRASLSKRHLNEVMTAFWDNHFNTDFNRHGRFEREQADNAAFRQHALGRFRDLLGASARSTAMMAYLDNMHSHKRAPNENYARELLELHTMSEGYTQQDIDEVARAFTGWTILDQTFAYAPDRHDDDAKIVLGQTIPAGGGEADGEQVLDILAARPETARHVCRKLAMRFVADEPPAALVMRCANLFLSQRQASNQLAQVLRLIFMSTEFRDAANRGSKVKDSMQFALAAMRATEGLRSGNDLPRIVANLAQPLLTYPAPDGYAMDSASWTGPYLYRTRLEFVGALMESHPQGTNVSANPRALLHSWPVANTTEGVAARVLQNLNGGAFDASELATAIATLTDDGARPFALDAPHADEALARLVRTAMSLPRYQLH